MIAVERRYRVTYTATIVVEVDAETPEIAQEYAQSDVIVPLARGSLVRREIWIPDISVATATIVADNAAPKVEEVPE